MTRLDYEAVNMACLAFAFVRDVFDGQIESDPEAALLYSEVNVRVRHALKLQIFYMTMSVPTQRRSLVRKGRRLLTMTVVGAGMRRGTTPTW